MLCNWKMMKAEGEVAVRWLCSIANVAWKTGAVPEDWKKALVIPVQKREVKRNVPTTVASIF